METISSFTVNHNTLTLGMYTSRVDSDIVTYDIRMALPNGGNYLPNNGIHSFEHLFATFVRNSPHKDSIVYVGPMGCRTGFYLLVRDTVSPAETIALVQDSCEFIANYTGNVPGNKPIECGNSAGHSLPEARAMAAVLREALKGWTTDQLTYPE